MRRFREDGQSTVEFALIIPLVFLTVLLVLQIGLLVYAELAVTHIAREVARGLAVEPSLDVGRLTPELTALGSSALDVSTSFEVLNETEISVVNVAVSYELEPIFGVFHVVFDHIDVQAEAKMMVEA